MGVWSRASCLFFWRFPPKARQPLTLCLLDVLYVDNLAVFPAKFRAMDFDHEYRPYYDELGPG